MKKTLVISLQSPKHREEPAELWVHYQTCEETLSALYLLRKTRRLPLCANYRRRGRVGCMRGHQCHRGAGKKGGNPEGPDQDQEAVTRFTVDCDVCEETPGDILTSVSHTVV